MKSYYGYVGNILHVNLTNGRIRKEPLDLDVARKFLGGPGIGLSILHDLLKTGVDAHSPDNVMVFGTGPLLGTPVPGSGKCYLLCTSRVSRFA